MKKTPSPEAASSIPVGDSGDTAGYIDVEKERKETKKEDAAASGLKSIPKKPLNEGQIIAAVIASRLRSRD